MIYLKMNWTPSKNELRKFGTVIMIGLGAIGLFFLARRKVDIGQFVLLGASLVFVLSRIAPGLAKPVYWVWMLVGLSIGYVVSRLVMFFIFFGILTPFAVFFRLTKRDALSRGALARRRESHWINLKPVNDKSYYEHLF